MAAATVKPFRSRFLYEFAALVHANVVNNVDIDDETLIDIFNDPERLAKPNKHTILHHAINEIVGFYIEYTTGHSRELEISWYKEILLEADHAIPEWLNEKEFAENIYVIDRVLMDASEKITPSVFHILFSDKGFLENFNRKISLCVEKLLIKEHGNILRKDGVIKRPNYFPTWLKIAVFHRDKGRCQNFWCDLTGIISLGSGLITSSRL